MAMITSETRNSFIGESRVPNIPLASQFPNLITKPAENMKTASKRSWKAFAKKCWAGLFKPKDQNGPENTSQNTTVSLSFNDVNNQQMTNVVKNKPMFQWIRGDRMGTIVKSTGETVIDGNMEFMVFEDGSQCNIQLIGEWILPIDNAENAPYMPEPPQQPRNVPVPVKEPIIERQVASSNPVHDLLKMSKKKSMKMQLSITVEIPSEDLIKVIHDSYPNGSKHIGDYLVSTIDQNSITKQIETLLRAKVDEVTVTKKKRLVKNESNI